MQYLQYDASFEIYNKKCITGPDYRNPDKEMLYKHFEESKLQSLNELQEKNSRGWESKPQVEWQIHLWVIQLQTDGEVAQRKRAAIIESGHRLWQQLSAW